MSLAWIVTGAILLGGMVAGAISLYIKRRRVEGEGAKEHGILCVN